MAWKLILYQMFLLFITILALDAYLHGGYLISTINIVFLVAFIVGVLLLIRFFKGKISQTAGSFKHVLVAQLAFYTCLVAAAVITVLRRFYFGPMKDIDALTLALLVSLIGYIICNGILIFKEAKKALFRS